MFRNVFTVSLRGYRWAILAWGTVLGIAVLVHYATFAQTFTGTSAAQIRQLVTQFQFFGEAVKVGTPGGFVTFKILGLVPVILGIWTVLVGARITRGAEEQGLLDLLLSTPHSRGAVLTQTLLALGAAIGLIALLLSGWIVFGMATARATVDPARALLAGLNVGLTAFLFGALSLLLAQFMGRPAAAGWAGGLMALSFVVDGTGRAMSGATGLRPLSPLYYYNRNLPLVPGYPVNWAAYVVLAVLALLLAAAAGLIFLRRDVGRTAMADLALRRDHQEAAAVLLAREAGSLWTRDVGRQALRRQGTAMLGWLASLTIFAGYLIAVAKTSERQFQQLLGNSAFIRQLFGGTDIGTNSGFVSVLVFGYLPLLFSIFAGFMAHRWATDLEHGRLELVLGTPHSRRRIILARYGAVALAVTVTALGVWLAIVLFARGIGFTLDTGRVAEASVGMLPLALITASLVFALAGILRPGTALGVMTGFLAVSYLTDLLRTVLSLPGWVVNVSIFRQYGTPLLTGLNWRAFAAMLAIAAALLALSVRQFSIRDVERGVTGT